ncbi:uncharacterized protein LOC131617681 [Vicia villosa]|uniref:uncharacterized protein LOC131617681 n=1 Tax=Vicia villosa TaxID=3911 RepID=UPI00273BB2EB|nr:uncharacterized protein LOC131617681 [Vicia villosa]
MMKIKHAIFLCLCAMLLISIVAIEPYEDENQFGEIEKSMRNMGQWNGGYKNKGVYIDGPLTNGEGRGENRPLFPDCEKDSGSEGGDCGGHGTEASGGIKSSNENAIPIPIPPLDTTTNRWWTRGPPKEERI